MSTPQVCILRAPGTNCDEETAHAFTRAGATAERLHVNRLLESPRELERFQILCIPGGFSFGDDVGAGVLFGTRLRQELGEALRQFLDRETLTLGICNGFQVLVKAGILPSPGEFPSEQPRRLTLTWNTDGRYDTRWVTLRTVRPDSPFLRGIETLEVPMAHAEGRVVLSNDLSVSELLENGQIALCYRGTEDDRPFAVGDAVLPQPANPNGSVANIAGLSSPDGRVLGLMPHPERFVDGTQHPQWTRRELPEEGAGLAMFRNAVNYFA